MIILKKIINFVIYFLIKIKFLALPKKSLRVLMFHNISDVTNFENQIELLKKDWKFINPNEFFNFIKEKKRINDRYILLTFDDGFKSNLNVANKILKKNKLKAIFFVPLKFILIKKDKDMRKFIKENLKINYIEKGMKNLNLNDLKKLKKMKFLIGAHTFSHINLKKFVDNNNINYEIVGSANKLQKILKMKIENFSFNFGRLNDISEKSLILSKKRFKYIYTGIRGENLNSKKLIFRDNILPNYKVYDLYAYLSGYLDFIYKYERKKIKDNFNKITE